MYAGKEDLSAHQTPLKGSTTIATWSKPCSSEGRERHRLAGHENQALELSWLLSQPGQHRGPGTAAETQPSRQAALHPLRRGSGGPGSARPGWQGRPWLSSSSPFLKSGLQAGGEEFFTL